MSHFFEGASPCIFAASSGRIQLELQAEPVGGDLVVILKGGAAHIGAVALADAAGSRCLQRWRHREGEIAENMAAVLAAELACAVTVICGIHYDSITKAEIDVVLRLAVNLQNKLISSRRQRK